MVMKKKTILLILILIPTITITPGTLHYLIYYKPDIYDCTEMSRDMEDKLESLGFDVHLKRGKKHVNDNVSHLWVTINGVSIDSVLWLPFYPDLIYPCNQTMYKDYEDIRK